MVSQTEPFHLIHLRIEEGIKWYNFTKLYKIHKSWREVGNEIIYRIVNFVIVRCLIKKPRKGEILLWTQW